MKKRIVYSLICLSLAYMAIAQEPPYDLSFFTNSRMPGSWFYGNTLASGGSTIKNVKDRLPVNGSEFHSPGNSIVLDYHNASGGSWQALIVRAAIRGQDHFVTPKFFSFWIFNTSAATHDQDLPTVRLIRNDRTKRDTVSSASLPFGNVGLNKWTEVIIPIEQFKLPAGFSPRDIVGLAFSQKPGSNGDHKIYLDDISFRSSNVVWRPTTTPTITSATGYSRHVDITWKPVSDVRVKWVKLYRSVSGGPFEAIGIQDNYTSRYADFTGETGSEYSYKISFIGDGFGESPLSNAISAKTHAMTDDEMLTMVQEACFRYYWEGAEANSGLAKENINGRHNMIATGASGFGIMALIVGTERKFITREQSITRFLKILDFLEKADKFHGAFSHFIDGITGKVETFFGRTDNGGDLVETSFLAQGLLAARQYFTGNDPREKQIRDRITGIWKNIEWDWYRRTPDNKFLVWHWSPDHQWAINHQLIGWNETMVTYLLAIASPTHAVPATMYYSGWANQDSTGQKYRRNWGGTTDGSMYTNGNTYFGVKLDVGVSNGGPLFFTHYSYMGYDPHLLTDRYTNYFTNNQNIAKINHDYAMLNPGHYKGYGDSCWGLTASDGPYDYSADEPVLERDKGKIGPTGAVSSFPYTPEESLKAMKNYYENYGKFIWGEYGFRDAFNLTDNWCSEMFMGLNQAPMVVMIENYRTGLIWKLFMSNQDITEGLKRLEAVK